MNVNCPPGNVFKESLLPARVERRRVTRRASSGVLSIIGSTRRRTLRPRSAIGRHCHNQNARRAMNDVAAKIQAGFRRADLRRLFETQCA